jgi:hypothetical protein
MTDAQTAMIRAAQKIAAMMPARPAKRLMGDRTEQLVFTVYEEAAKAAFLRAAQECLTCAWDAAGGVGIDFEGTNELICDKSISLAQLEEMCRPGYAWGGSVVTK